MCQRGTARNTSKLSMEDLRKDYEQNCVPLLLEEKLASSPLSLEGSWECSPICDGVMTLVIHV